MSFASCAVVGHSLTAASVNVVPECRPLSVEYPAEPLPNESPVVAVGHVVTWSFRPIECPCCCLAFGSAPPVPEPSLAVGERHEEESVAMVRRSNIGRSESAPLSIIPERGKVFEDDFESARAERGNVFNEDQSRLNLLDDSGELLPEPASLPSDACALSGNGDVLTREAAKDDVHQATKWLAVEGGHIRPNRRWVQVVFLHARSQDFAGVGFPLHVSDRSALSNCQLDAEVESGRAAEKADCSELGRIHK